MSHLRAPHSWWSGDESAAPSITQPGFFLSVSQALFSNPEVTAEPFFLIRDIRE